MKGMLRKISLPAVIASSLVLAAVAHGQVQNSGFGEVIRTKSPDPLHYCTAAPTTPSLSPHFRPTPEEKAIIMALEKELNELIVEAVSQHQKILDFKPDWRNSNLVVIRDIAMELYGEMIMEKKTANLLYDKDNKINCLILDSMQRNRLPPYDLTRRFVRIGAGENMSIELVTLQGTSTVKSYLRDMNPSAQIDGLRLVISYLRNVVYTIDVKLLRLEQEKKKKNKSLSDQFLN